MQEEQAGYVKKDRGDQFLYKTTFKYKAIDEEIEGADLPSDIPAFGGNAISFRFEPKLSAEVSGAGKFKAELEPGTFESAAFCKVAGLSFNKLQPRFFLTGQYAPCGWAWSGGAELSVNADLRVEGPPSYFPIPTAFGPIPGYFVWGARVELPVRFAVKGPVRTQRRGLTEGVGAGNARRRSRSDSLGRRLGFR